MDDPSMQNMQELRNQYMEQQRQQREQQEQLLQQQRMQQQQAAMQRQQQAMFQQQAAAQRQQAMVGGGFGLGSLIGGGALTGMFTGGAYRGGPQSLAQLGTRYSAALSADFLGSLGMGGLGRYLFGNMGYSAQFGNMTADYAANRAGLGYRQFFAGMVNTGAGRLLSFGAGDEFALSQSRLQRQQFAESILRQAGGARLSAIGARGEGDSLIDPNSAIFSRISRIQEEAIQRYAEREGLSVKDQDIQELLQYSSSFAMRSMQERGLTSTGRLRDFESELQGAMDRITSTLEEFSATMGVSREAAAEFGKQLANLGYSTDAAVEAMEQTITMARAVGMTDEEGRAVAQTAVGLAARQSLGKSAIQENLMNTSASLAAMIREAKAAGRITADRMSAFGDTEIKQGQALAAKLQTAGPQNVRELLAYGRDKGLTLEGDLGSMLGQVSRVLDPEEFAGFITSAAGQEKTTKSEIGELLLQGLSEDELGIGKGFAKMLQKQYLNLDAGALSALEALPGGDGSGSLTANTTATETLTGALRRNTQALEAQAEADKKVRIREQEEIETARARRGFQIQTFNFPSIPLPRF